MYKNKTEETSVRCIAYGCSNHSDPGNFIGELCAPCHEYMTTGIIGPSYNSLGDIKHLKSYAFSENFFDIIRAFEETPAKGNVTKTLEDIKERKQFKKKMLSALNNKTKHV